MTDGTQYTYEGSELETFAQAINWKNYVRSHVDPYLTGRVLEVGAGLGGTTEVLAQGRTAESWVCLEPDPNLAAVINSRKHEGRLPPECEVIQGTIAKMVANTFDTVLYIDVLEHILDDGAELAAAGRLLKPGGRLVVLSPAHPWLFSPFDNAIGHHRRYTRATLETLTPPHLTVIEAKYLDAAGLLASLGNRLLLRSAYPSRSQIRFWDQVLVSTSRWIDPIFRHRLGKSILLIWRRI